MRVPDLSLPADTPHSLLSPAEMAQVDQAAAALGQPGVALMEAAGRAVAQAVQHAWSPRLVVVLCGPGNNGGDGFVVARCLAEAGWPVRVALLGRRDALCGDAAHHAGLWQGPVLAAEAAVLDGADLVVDALFGAGLRGSLSPEAQTLLQAVSDRGLPVCAVDLPSGLDGGTGQPLGVPAAAALTVTFCRRKPGHLLLPGRALCGHVIVADIGIPPAAVASVGARTWENVPSLWLPAFPWPRAAGHKYDRGHVLVAGGRRMTGAARLAGHAAGRAGAGLVTLSVPADVWSLYAAAVPAALLVETCDEAAQWRAGLADSRRNCVLLGPGSEPGASLRARVIDTLSLPLQGGGRRAVVLDAGALTSFAGQAALLSPHLHDRCVLTPHQGEFDRLFPAQGARSPGDKLARARQAAADTAAVILLKGADTVVAAPDGRAYISRHAPPTLASGGTGDVLAGLVAGLLAQGMPAFHAAAAASWLHGEAARLAGHGLLADDLPLCLPRVLRRLFRQARNEGLLPADAAPLV